MTLADLFPDEDYRFQMRFERGSPAEFFQHTAEHQRLVSQRRHWLETDTDSCARFLPEAAPLLEETVALAKSWQSFSDSAGAKSDWERCLALARFWEPDFLLLKADANDKIRLLGGCVCFPSSWRLSEKVGKPIEIIHGVVPGLNASIGSSIHAFLSKLKPGIAWQRANWGLSRSPELNQHPDRELPRLDSTARLDEVWLRVEYQALVALPESGGILFGIRIAVHPLAQVRADATIAKKLCHALATMPEEMARYKSLAAARSTIVRMLGGELNVP